MHQIAAVVRGQIGRHLYSFPKSNAFGLIRPRPSIQRAATLAMAAKMQAGSSQAFSSGAGGPTPRINGQRLMDSLHSTCEFGKAHRYGDHHTETGMARLSLNDDDKAVRLWLKEQAEAIDCTVTVDQMGNMFIVRPGRTKDVAPVYIGSHLDTQMTGGRYDGILGVMAGLEALRTLHETGYETQGPMGLVNWTNEEGARFPMVTMSSGVWAGKVPLSAAWECVEITAPAGSEPQTFRAELERIGFLGEREASHRATPMAAHFELHIEQGPVLEREGLRIGVVAGAQGYSWYEVEVTGRDCHAGTTPLAARRDALLAAARMIVAGNTVAKQSGGGVLTTGVMRVEPATINTIARVARFTVDVRHPDADALAAMVARCQAEFARIAAEDCEQGVDVRWTCLTENEPVVFHPDCVAAIEQAADEEVGPDSAISGHRKLWTSIWSGAGHDSCNASKHCPTGMVFTPTRDGLSHTPTEYCSPEDCILGAQVLFGAALRFDASRRL